MILKVIIIDILFIKWEVCLKKIVLEVLSMVEVEGFLLYLRLRNFIDK